jgi:hypothetical protein
MSPVSFVGPVQLAPGIRDIVSDSGQITCIFLQFAPRLDGPVLGAVQCLSGKVQYVPGLVQMVLCLVSVPPG